MIEVKTQSGFECSIDENNMNDYEVVEALVDVEDGNPAAIVKVTRHLLSSEDQKRLKAHCKDESGKVPFDMMVKELTDIICSLKSGKNS